MATYAPAASMSDTAFLAAFYRAKESERPDAIFDDPFAQILSGERGELSASKIPCLTAGFGCAVRTWLIDNLITDFLQRESANAVLNLGAGLDTRPYRLALPSQLKWIEVDDHAMLEYKRARLQKAHLKCQLGRYVDLVTDTWCVDRVLSNELNQGERCLVITEGLLVYLDERTVARIAEQLQGSPFIAAWITDLASPLSLRLMDQVEMSAIEQCRPEWKFAPEDGLRFFEKLGWQAALQYSSVEAGYRLNRELFPQSEFLKLPESQQQLLRLLSQVALLLPNRFSA